MLMVLLAINFDNLHQILQNLYTDMMPLCSQMTGVAKGLAGLGALFYVAYRVPSSGKISSKPNSQSISGCHPSA